MKTIFKYEGLNPNLKKACEVANAIFPLVIRNLEENKIMLVNSYDRPSYYSSDLAGFIEIYAEEMTIQTYFYKNRGVYGMYDASKPTTIFINTESLPRHVASLVATFYHELIHFIDTRTTVDLGHGKGWTRNFWKPWKEKTGPFYVDSLAEVLAINYLGEATVIPTDNTKIVTRPLWHRILFFWR
jgi:hypothetical protein